MGVVLSVRTKILNDSLFLDVGFSARVGVFFISPFFSFRRSFFSQRPNNTMVRHCVRAFGDLSPDSDRSDPTSGFPSFFLRFSCPRCAALPSGSLRSPAGHASHCAGGQRRRAFFPPVPCVSALCFFESDLGFLTEEMRRVPFAAVLIHALFNRTRELSSFLAARDIRGALSLLRARSRQACAFANTVC